MTATVTLYERTEALRLVDEWIAEHEEELLAAGGDVSALPELAELLDAAEGDFKEKAERVALKVRELMAECVAVELEADRLNKRAAARKRAADSLKEYLKLNMEKAGVEKVNGLLCNVAIQKSPPSVRHAMTQAALCLAACDTRFESMVDEVPSVFKLDAKAVIAAAKEGRELPEGVTVEQGTHLRIR